MHADPVIEHRRYQAHPHSHQHDYCQILFGLAGHAELDMHGHTYCTSSQHGVIVPAGFQHIFAGDRHNAQWVIDLPVNSIALPRHLLDTARGFTIPPLLQSQLRTMGSYATLPRPHRWQYTLSLLDSIIRSVGLTPGQELQFPVEQIDQFLRTHYHAALSTESLAQHFGWGTRRFHDLFTTAFGDTPHRYLTRLRLDKATQLLMQHNIPLTDIADMLGYADQPSFTHAFKARFGLAPGKWRASGDTSTIASLETTLQQNLALLDDSTPPDDAMFN